MHVERNKIWRSNYKCCNHLDVFFIVRESDSSPSYPNLRNYRLALVIKVMLRIGFDLCIKSTKVVIHFSLRGASWHDNCQPTHFEHDSDPINTTLTSSPVLSPHHPQLANMEHVGDARARYREASLQELHERIRQRGDKNQRFRFLDLIPEIR